MNIVLSNASDDPIYVQIVRQVRAAILGGELRPGQSLPSIRQLAKDLQISVITTKRAYEELESEGLIDSVVGKGSFVSDAHTERIREKRRRQLAEKLAGAAAESRALGIGFEELAEMIKLQYDKEER